MSIGLFLSSLFLILSIVIWLVSLIAGILVIRLNRHRADQRHKFSGWLIIIIGVVFGSLLFWPSVSYFHIERLWFSEMGYSSVFWKLMLTPWLLFLRFSLTAGVFLVANFVLVLRLCPTPSGFQRWAVGGGDNLNRVIIALIIIVSIIMGSFAIPMWDEYLKYRAREPFIIKNPGTGEEEVVYDPQFNRDIGYYLFTFPVRNFSSLWTKALFWIAFIGIGILYNFYRNRDSQSSIYVTKRGIFHLSGLWVLVLIVSLWRSHINILKLVYSRRGVAFGAGYNDINVRIPGYHIYMVIVALVILAVLINLVWRKRFLITIPGILWFSSYLIIIWLVPYFYQYIKVSPNESIWEREYISRNIRYTRMAYELNRIKVSEIIPEVATLEKVKSHPGTLRNVQLWDRRATRETLNQVQVFRPYYTFWDVDADRYHLIDPVTGQVEYRQVMISAREIDIERLPSRTWVTQKLIYTHGHGLCLGPVNQFTPEGLPHLWIKGTPPVISRPELNITRPEIYYGEVPKEYVFVKTTQMEFDYPETKGVGEEEDHYTTYKGDGGIPLKSFFRRILLAIRFLDFRIITSEHLKPDSRIMFNRQISDRSKSIAPFLFYDNDPYIVVGESGKFWWVIDSYTISKDFPYSEPYFNKFNYIRNPLKAVIDAYNGKVEYYIWDENEVLAKVYRKAFPGLFKGRSEMPDGLDKHNRYPDDLTSIQSEMFCLYHMQDPQTFYAKGDAWELPYEVYHQEREQPVVPLYVMIQLPDGEKEEFVSIISFTPYPTKKRPNMVAWMAVRNDVPRYGEIFVYIFPKGQTIPGPAQIESRIDTNPEISEKLTLWNEGGSRVIRGNLLTLPVDNALFYVEPLYLESQITRMPLLTQVIVAAGDKVAWGQNFEMAVEKVFEVGEKIIVGEEVQEEQPAKTADQSQQQTSEKTPTATDTTEPRALIDVISSLSSNFSKYQEQVKSGDADNASKTLEKINKDIAELEKYKKLLSGS